MGSGFKKGTSMITSHLPHHLAIFMFTGLVQVGVGNMFDLLLPQVAVTGWEWATLPWLPQWFKADVGVGYSQAM